MLKEIVQSTGLSQDVCALLIGINPKVFNEWVVGQRAIPPFFLPQLSTVFGVPISVLTSDKPILDAPAVWYKLRDDRILDADREWIVLVRRLGFFLAQLENVTKTETVLWKSIFHEIRPKIDMQSSPSDQGKVAARYFRTSRGLSSGARGLGHVVRDNLRNAGLLIIESPLPKSNLEGCCFYVGQQGSEVPCLFANTYRSTWFRRNMILAHELGHAIFDLDSEAVSLDYREENDEYPELRERRAHAFAQELLVPMDVLRHVQSTSGFVWESLQVRDLATLVAETEVEAKLVLKAVREAGFIDRDLELKYSDFDIWNELKQLTPRALDTKEFLRQTLCGPTLWPANKRTTSIASRRLRLPVSYVKNVLTALNSEDISLGKAAEMLMMDKGTLRERFGAEVGAAL